MPVLPWAAASDFLCDDSADSPPAGSSMTWNDDPHSARTEARQLPVFGQNARAHGEKLGVHWPDLLRLRREGLLSFDPEDPGWLDEAQEMELRFLGALVAAGCSTRVLRVLVEGLRKPYCYDPRRVFFDWVDRRWRLLPGEDDPEACFFTLLERLRDRDERQMLLQIRAWLDEAFDLERERQAAFAHEGAAN
jgi:hypothetical protein